MRRPRRLPLPSFVRNTLSPISCICKDVGNVVVMAMMRQEIKKKRCSWTSPTATCAKPFSQKSSPASLSVRRRYAAYIRAQFAGRNCVDGCNYQVAKCIMRGLHVVSGSAFASFDKETVRADAVTRPCRKKQKKDHTVARWRRGWRRMVVLVSCCRYGGRMGGRAACVLEA